VDMAPRERKTAGYKVRPTLALALALALAQARARTLALA
jgi:hypothetical protein